MRKWMIEHKEYTEHHRSMLLLEILLYGDYQTAAAVIDDEIGLTDFDFQILSKFADGYVFGKALNVLEDYQKPRLAAIFLKMSGKVFDAEEKIFQITKFHAFNQEFLEQICRPEKEELFRIFAERCHQWAFDGIYAQVLKDAGKILVRKKIFTLLKILAEYSVLEDEIVLQMGIDQFAWYAGQHKISSSIVENIYADKNLAKFRIVFKEQGLTENQISNLFNSGMYEFFQAYTEEHRLAEKFEKKLFCKGMQRYLNDYLCRHQIKWWNKICYRWF